MHRRKILAVVILWVCCLVLLASENKTSSTASLSTSDNANLNNAVTMFHHGRRVFRFDTFGSEAFFGDDLQLHRAY
jgi:hypothetical protein